MTLPDSPLQDAIGLLKREYVRSAPKTLYLSEVLPDASESGFPIKSADLQSLHKFAKSNEIYVSYHSQIIGGLNCIVYGADINNFWLGSKKHDACYQPFYPTWLVSAYALAETAKSLGFSELVDIGAGDGRIAYCGRLLGMRSIGIELDGELSQLQMQISSRTRVQTEAVCADATRFDYGALGLKRPMFFISGLPEMGDMLARGIIDAVLSDESLRSYSGFNFMGSHVSKKMSVENAGWGWGSVISHFGLRVLGTLTLPTYWTVEQPIDTAYVYTLPG